MCIRDRHNASRLPFLQYAENRPLREQIYKAYINRGNNNNENDNKENIRKIVSLRLEKAKLLGFDCYANFVLDETMAKNATNVMDLLNNLWSYALPKAKEEAAELQKLMDKEGKGEKLEAWDWWYYTEKLRKEKYNLSEEETKPYFKLENVREGAFAVANKLYGITFNKQKGIPTYHPDAVSYTHLCSSSPTIRVLPGHRLPTSPTSHGLPASTEIPLRLSPSLLHRSSPEL